MLSDLNEWVPLRSECRSKTQPPYMGVCNLCASTSGCKHSSIKKIAMQVKPLILILKYRTEFLKEFRVIIRRMCSYISPRRRVLIGLILMLLILTGCVRPSPDDSTALPSPVIQKSSTPAIPTSTPLPLALEVNGEGVLLADYDSELARLQMALVELGTEMPEQEQKQRVLDQLIDTTLLSQEAIKAGFTLEDAQVQERLDTLATEMGGSVTLMDWMNTYGYDDASLLRTLKRSMLAAWQRDQITAAVGDTADQVHARQIRVGEEAVAQTYFARLQSGIDFATIALEEDPLTGGELGWFPQGYLLQPELNDIVFTLNPGEYSQVIETQIGYHIIQVIERDAQHALTSETRQFLQHKALEDWLVKQKESAVIKVLVP